MKSKLKGLAQAITTASGACKFEEPCGVIRKKPGIVADPSWAATAHVNAAPITG